MKVCINWNNTHIITQWIWHSFHNMFTCMFFLHTFTFFWLRKTVVTIEIFRLSFRVFVLRWSLQFLVSFPRECKHLFLCAGFIKLFKKFFQRLLHCLEALVILFIFLFSKFIILFHIIINLLLILMLYSGAKEMIWRALRCVVRGEFAP